MNEEYLKYWGLAHHPFLLAPDGKMMCITGQYFECLERLKYAINTNKGGVLIASEDPGLGKTTILLKLIEEMQEEYGKNFKYAFIDHPTLTASQMIEQITGAITGQMPSDDKLKNLNLLKESLIETKKEGGKNLIIIDEGQMLCDSRDILQEMRVLINLIYNNEYLHTFILSGQKALWDTLQGIPEFWQRLPVRYYFTPLRFEETRELIRYRLNKAGLDVTREIFTDESLEIIHKYSQGLPRTIIAVADLSLLNGFSDRTRKISFKEVTKAINSMGGKGESLSYVMQERKGEKEPAPNPATTNQTQAAIKSHEYIIRNVKEGLDNQSTGAYLKTALIVVAVLFLVFFGAMLGKHLSSSARPVEKSASPVPERQVVGPPTQPGKEDDLQEEKIADAETGIKTITDKDAINSETKPNKDLIAAYKEEREKKSKGSIIVNKDAANVRSNPSLDAPRILTIVKGEVLNIIDEKKDNEGMVWYKVLLYNNREGWIADKVVILASTP